MKKISVALLILSAVITGAIAGVADTAAGPQIVVNTMDSGNIPGLALGADGKILYSSDEYAGTIKSWDTESGRLLRTWSGFGYIQQMIMSTDAKMICVRDLNRTAVLNAVDGKEIRDFPRQYSGCAFSPDGTMLALCITVSAGSMSVYDVVSGVRIRDFPMKAYSYAVAFRPDGKEIAVCGGDDRIHIFDVMSGDEKRSFEGPADKVHSLAYSPDGEYLALGAPDKRVIVRDAESGKIRYTIDDFPAEATALVYGPEGKTIAVGADKTLRIVKARNGKTVYECVSKFNQSKVGRSAVFSPDGKKIYTASFGISAWDLDNEKESGSIGGTYAAFCNGVVFSPDGKKIAFAGDSSFRVIDMESGDISFGSAEYLMPSVSMIRFSDDGSRLFAGCDKMIDVYDVLNGKRIRTIRSGDAITGQSASPDGKRIAYVAGKTLNLCDLSDAEKDQSVVMAATPKAVEFTPDGKTLIVNDPEGNILFLSLPGLREVSRMKAPKTAFATTMVFFPDGKRLAVGGSGEIHIINIPSRRVVRTLMKTPSFLTCIAFSPDGKTMFACGDRDEIPAWDTVTWKEKEPLRGHSGKVRIAAFSRDGKLLITGGSDKIFRFWDMPAGKQSGGLVLSSGSYSSTTVTTVNGKVTTRKTESGIVKDYLIITSSGLYDGTNAELSRLHWVVGNEVIPLNEFGESFRSPGLLGQLLSAHVIKPPINASQHLFGKVRSISGNDIIVSYSGSRAVAQVRERFFVFLDNGEKVELEAVFPMMTSMKCRTVNAQYKNAVRPGMPVFR